MIWPLIVAILVGTGVLSGLSRWMLKSIRRSFDDAVRETVSPHLECMSGKLDKLATENAADHAKVDARLSRVEARLAALEGRLGLD